MRRPSSRWFPAVALLLGAAGWGAMGCASEGTSSPPRRVFLITVDTLRADHLGAWGYARDTSPNIDRLAGSSIVCERAVAQWPLTGPSFASMMSGLYPRSTGRIGRPHVAPPEGVPLLAEVLRGQGYATAAVVSNRVLAASAGWDRGFDEFHETWAAAPGPLSDAVVLKSWLTAPKVNEIALPLLERHRDAPKLFVWLHYSDPHTPYTVPEGFDNPFRGGDPSPVPARLHDGAELEGLETLGEYVNHYDANILLADRAIGEVLERRDALGLGEDALTIFTADHGESLGEHGYYFRHGRYPYSPSTHVPLLFHDPRRLGAPRRIAGPVQLVDLYPTVVALMAPDAMPDGLEGESLLEALRGERQPRGLAFAESGQGRFHFLAVQDAQWKLVLTRYRDRDGDRERRVKTALYSMVDDPLETRDVLAIHSTVAVDLKRRLAEWLRATPPARSDPGVEPTAEMLEALRALGYTE